MAQQSKKTKEAAAKFSKAALVNSDMFSRIDRDILQTALKDDATYSVDEAKQILEKFRGGI